MRIAVISDLHANFEALKALDDVLDSADQVVCLGDLVGYYCQVNEVISAIRERDALCILGNHDHYLLQSATGVLTNPGVRFGIEFANAAIDGEHRKWLATLPLSWGGTIGGLTWLLVHGSPWKPLEDYLYADSSLLSGLDSFAYDLIAFGQTHRPLCRDDKSPMLLNPGSVGQSRHREGVACAAIVDTAASTVDMIERSYDFRPVLDLARSHGAGVWIKRHFEIAT